MCSVSTDKLILSWHFVFQKLKHTESDKLQVQIQAYLDNVFDVGALLEDAETKNAALERVEELEENISHVRASQRRKCPGVQGELVLTSVVGSEGIWSVGTRNFWASTPSVSLWVL